MKYAAVMAAGAAFYNAEKIGALIGPAYGTLLELLRHALVAVTR